MKNKLTSCEIVGVILGFGIASVLFQLMNFGFIEAVIIAYGCYWIVKSICKLICKFSKDKVIKIPGSLKFVFFCLFIMFVIMLFNLRVGPQIKTDNSGEMNEVGEILTTEELFGDIEK